MHIAHCSSSIEKTYTMNSSSPFWLLLLLFLPAANTFAQVNYTAHDTIPEFQGRFRYGANMGAYWYWTDQDLADIAAGNPELGIEGIGIDALRPLLSEWFLEFWGYDIRVDAFNHYKKLGVEDNVVFVGYPSEEHRDPTEHCPGVRSELFANMYLPIWDNGENGTPVNEENFYAAYMWKMVNTYTHNVKYWEIWNEPDFDFVGGSSLQPGEEGNWWENDPDPCQYAIHAPIQHYIRLLRISYEVIKTISPDDYVALGGIGYASFVDALLRNTDNPMGGGVDSLYPLKGGAYFDVVSYHSYPHIDNSLRIWSNDIGGFKYFRHSDRCVDGMLNRQAQIRGVLENYGFDGETYPEKKWIITESNIPRVQVDEFLGSPEAQRNYIIKSLVACQMNEIDQFHVYQMGDISDPNGFSEFHSMGLFARLDSIPKKEEKQHDIAVAYKTTSDLLSEKKFNAEQTAALELPEDIRGAAFQDENGKYTYVLWARTNIDRSEKASAEYSFPTEFNLKEMHQREWNFGRRGITQVVEARSVKLTGAPVFLTPSTDEAPANPVRRIEMTCSPNPFGQNMHVSLNLPDPMTASLSLFDMQGRLVEPFIENIKLADGEHRISLPATAIPRGVYVLYFESAQGRQAVCRVVK